MSKEPVFRERLDLRGSLQIFQAEALQRLCRLSDYNGGNWVPIAKFYDACGSIGLIDTHNFERMVRDMGRFGLVHVQRDAGEAIVAVSPAHRVEVIGSASIAASVNGQKEKKP